MKSEIEYNPVSMYPKVHLLLTKLIDTRPQFDGESSVDPPSFDEPKNKKKKKKSKNKEKELMELVEGQRKTPVEEMETFKVSKNTLEHNNQLKTELEKQQRILKAALNVPNDKIQGNANKDIEVGKKLSQNRNEVKLSQNRNEVKVVKNAQSQTMVANNDNKKSLAVQNADKKVERLENEIKNLTQSDPTLVKKSEPNKDAPNKKNVFHEKLDAMKNNIMSKCDPFLDIKQKSIETRQQEKREEDEREKERQRALAKGEKDEKQVALERKVEALEKVSKMRTETKEYYESIRTAMKNFEETFIACLGESSKDVQESLIQLREDQTRRREEAFQKGIQESRNKAIGTVVDPKANENSIATTKQNAELASKKSMKKKATPQSKEIDDSYDDGMTQVIYINTENPKEAMLEKIEEVMRSLGHFEETVQRTEDKLDELEKEYCLKETDEQKSGGAQNDANLKIKGGASEGAKGSQKNSKKKNKKVERGIERTEASIELEKSTAVLKKEMAMIKESVIDIREEFKANERCLDKTLEVYGLTGKGEQKGKKEISQGDKQEESSQKECASKTKVESKERETLKQKEIKKKIENGKPSVKGKSEMEKETLDNFLSMMSKV